MVNFLLHDKSLVYLASKRWRFNRHLELTFARIFLDYQSKKGKYELLELFYYTKYELLELFFLTIRNILLLLTLSGLSIYFKKIN